jgi:hypothetical protein
MKEYRKVRGGLESKEKDCSHLNACTIPKITNIQKADHLTTGVGDIRVYTTFFSHTFHTTPGFVSKMTNTGFNTL